MSEPNYQPDSAGIVRQELSDLAPDLYNDDQLPTTDAQRSWNWVAIAALWVGMVVCIPTYLLASYLIGAGMSWDQAVMTILLANVIVLIPMLLIGHAGTRYGIPFPVLLRSSFGPAGAKIPAVARGIVACGWFGIQTWVALTLLIYGVATGASALVGGVAALLVLRFFVGLGLGAELPVASTYVSEFAPARIRGRLIVILEAFWAVGWTASALIGFFVIPASEAGWRWAFALGAIPAVYALVVRWGLPESPRWLASRGRIAEADRIVAAFEADAGVEYTPPLRKEPASRAIAKTARARLATLWNAEFRVRTACLWLVWLAVNFAYYGAFIWIPSILVDAGFDLVRSFGFTLIITLAQLPGYAVAAWLIEVWGRRITLSVFLLGATASAVVFGTATTVPMIIGAGMALSFFTLGAWGALYAVTPEIYPTSLRGTGAGWAAGVGRIASIVAPLAVPVLLVAGGAPLLFVVFAACFLVAAAAAWGLVDRSGAALDDR